jgi:ABC-2 type transport system permease protein
MNWRAIRAIVYKDLLVITRSRNTMLTFILLPVIFLVILPGGAVLLASNADAMSEFTSDSQDMEAFFTNMPPSITAEMESFTTENQRAIALVTLYFFAPLFLILPLMLSSMIAADSLAGEKDRKTLEALIYTPTTDAEIYTAKLLSAWIPALLVTLVGFVIYGIVVNATAWPIMGRIFFPNLTWIVLVLWLAPAAAGLGLSASVLVSSRVSTAQEAYQIGGLTVLPVVVLVIGQLAGVVYLSVIFILGVGLVIWLIDLVLLWFGARIFRRGELLSRL